MLERNYSRLRILRFGCGILIQVRTNGLIITSEDKTTSIYKIRLNGISTGYTKGEEKTGGKKWGGGEKRKKERKKGKREREDGNNRAKGGTRVGGGGEKGKRMRREGQKRKERGDRGSPDRCDTPAKIGRTAYANATVWPWWNAVKTDGANRREKASPTGLTVRQMGYFGPGSALLAYTCMRSRTRVSARAYTSGGGHGGFASRFHREQRFYSRARAARET